MKNRVMDKQFWSFTWRPGLLCRRYAECNVRERVERMEPEAADERIFGSAVGSIRDEMRQAVTGPEPLAALSAVAERIERASVAAEKRKPEG